MKIDVRPRRLILEVELASATDEAAIAKALDELLEVNLKQSLTSMREKLTTRARLPDGTELHERDLFEACAKFPAQRPKIATYILRIAEAAPWVDGESVYHDDEFAGGVFAAVPLALAERAYVPTLIAHMQSVDLNHASDYEMAVDRLLTVHGICDETLDLLAYFSCAWHEEQPLWLAVKAHDLLGRWDAFGGMAGFTERLDRLGELEMDEKASHGHEKLVSIGHSLFDGDADGLRRWYAQCEAQWSVSVRTEENGWRRPKRTAAISEKEWRAEWYRQPVSKVPKHLSIVLIDQEPEELAKRLAKHLPKCKLSGTRSSEAAIRAINWHQCQLAIVAADLEDGTGYGVVQRIRTAESLASIPIIGLISRDAQAALFEKAGANATCSRREPERLKELVPQLFQVTVDEDDL